MRLSNVRATVLVAGVAVVVSLGGAVAVQAQTSPGHLSGSKVVAGKTAVSSHANRFGFGPGQALIARDVISNRLGSVIRFDRTYRGLPVAGGDFVVHVSRSGAYQYANGRKVVGLPGSVRPSISKAAARSTAVASAGYRVARSSAKLAIFTTAHSSSLAWAVSTVGRNAANGHVTYVSARTGQTLARWATVMNDDSVNKQDVGVGKTEYSGKVKLPDIKKNGKYTLQDNTRGKQGIYNANHAQSEGVGTIFKDGNNVWGDFTETDVETPAADAAYGLANTWDFYLKTFNRHGIADDGVAARGFVHFGTDYVNAFWSDGCFCMEFGDGSAASGISPLTSLDVAGHEMTHGVTSRTAKLIYSGESGGLNESTSDVFGTMVEFFADNSEDVPDYVIGEEIFRNYDPANNYIRRMDKPSMDGASKDCWYSGIGGVNVHYSSGVGNHFFYLLSEGSGKKTINGIKYDSPTCNGKTIEGIGRDKAAAIWYKALTEEWVSTTNYHDARIGTLNAAKHLYGGSSAEYKAVNKAWAAVDVTP